MSHKVVRGVVGTWRNRGGIDVMCPMIAVDAELTEGQQNECGSVMMPVKGN